MDWQCTGLRWPEGSDGPALGWRKGARTRASVLAYGTEFGFRASGERRCSGARGNACPLGAVVPATSTGGRCPECGRLDRAHSVAADTVPDDPRTYRVYLAWFGPGMVKVGITAEERGAARLREQGAVVFSWLGRGPLMAARRAEEVLRAALGVPDRIPYARKREVRAALPDPAERAAEVAELYGRAAALEGAGLPEALERLPFAAVDHAEVFRLGVAGAGAGAIPRPGPGHALPRSGSVRAVAGLVDGGAVAGRLVAAAGPDLHLDAGAQGLVIVDTRLMTGWTLTAAGPGAAGVSVPTVVVGGGAAQDGLF
ncbi:DUF2797 domain-containing protein [Streptomyces drozdowiczii]|uniref:DUF2797 domain-containing protein n=2 Tax=Streptomyces drozdowiczii TaxID=202862 RepID=A0ABY6PSR8_9ACTN|nr:DUF2797 domain-containing protein [Streptomyces drozdowiczii]UZK55327.1 DUF2797 domain-containing protein [Streptomyces drozdowiczii]